MEKIIFGPVPSRRLGKSLGINNIPPKICSYSCVYCQLGKTLKMSAARQPFYEPERIVREAEEKVAELKSQGERIDYLTFVPDGEPTIDARLGQTIELLRPLRIKIAIITNSSLIWDKQVRQELKLADWVSVKIDSLSPEIWKKVNRPFGHLKLEAIEEGLLEFAHEFEGELVTETMLVKGLNDPAEEIDKIADFIQKLKPQMSYISVPIRPPAESWVEIPGEREINRAYQIFSQKSLSVELLTGYEGNAFATTGNLAEDLLSITSVHPMRQEAVEELVKKAGATWEVVEDLLRSNQLVEIEYQGNKFYLRRLIIR